MPRSPVLTLCHSMGGHILLRYLAEHGPGPLAAATIVSPMTGLHREIFLRSMLLLMPEIASMDHRYLFGTGPFLFLARDFAANLVTHDERRYRFTEEWFSADPRLSLGGPTVGWARQAARSMTASLVPGYLERIDLPVLLLTAGQDQIVDPASHGPVVARLRHAEHVTIAEAKHEIMMETDDIRARFWEAFDGFAGKVLFLTENCRPQRSIYASIVRHAPTSTLSNGAMRESSRRAAAGTGPMHLSTRGSFDRRGVPSSETLSDCARLQ